MTTDTARDDDQGDVPLARYGSLTSLFTAPALRWPRCADRAWENFIRKGPASCGTTR